MRLYQIQSITSRLQMPPPTLGLDLYFFEMWSSMNLHFLLFLTLMCLPFLRFSLLSNRLSFHLSSLLRSLHPHQPTHLLWPPRHHTVHTSLVLLPVSHQPPLHPLHPQHLFKLMMCLMLIVHRLEPANTDTPLHVIPCRTDPRATFSSQRCS